MFDDSSHGFSTLKVDKMTRVLDLPDDASLHMLLAAEAPLALALGLIFEFNQTLKFRRNSYAFSSNLQIAFANTKLGNIREVVRVFAQIDNTIIAGGVGFSFSLEVNFLANKNRAEKFTRLPGPWLVFRRVIRGASA